MNMSSRSRGPDRAPALTVRLARLAIGPNKLRRPCDRLEGFLILLLAAGFVACVALAPHFGERLYQAQQAHAAQLHPAVAVLTQAGPSDNYVTAVGEATARWRAPDGRQRDGVLSTIAAPAISGARTGTRVRVWLTSSGQPEAPPISAAESAFSAVVLTTGAVLGAAIALVISYWLGRLVIDRRRLANWTSEWSLTGPRWTTRL
jgi:hypothetical protein